MIHRILLVFKDFGHTDNKKQHKQSTLHGIISLLLSLQINHGADKLPYYTANFHMEYAMACKLRRGNLRDEETRALRYRTLQHYY